MPWPTPSSAPQRSSPTKAPSPSASSIASITPFPRNISQRPIAAACYEKEEIQIPFPIYKPCKIKNLRDGILWRGESSRELKALLYSFVHAPIGKENRRVGGRSDFPPPARKRASRQRVYEIQSHKDAARKERSHAGFASTANPRAKFSRTCTT